ncbi:hypothetical protein RN607_10050 [Demequina capsici]|uniref:Uncharacterized protein n=1 Tax=Demequina capsici TaxID=3075620 RepID=A0AA96FB66_9MICO|nr:hypothetical protein [Demequina sp. PMTSA13]WNM26539.1 hypothetical protein RN607_10050 [Demequina sp. PMTSA13]
MPVVSDRISERVTEDFGTSAPQVLSALERLGVDVDVDPERVHAAVLLVSRRSRTMLDDALEHAGSDWRDLLERAGLADDGWRQRVDDEFGRAVATQARRADHL